MANLYEIVDPRPVAATAKYTYFLPMVEMLGALEVGDLVQVTMRAIPPSEKWDAERVWFRIGSASSDWLEGTLESEPYDMPLIAKGEIIRAPRTHIIGIVFNDPNKEVILHAPQREFWDRCLVDQAVLDGELSVHYIYREAPEPTRDNDKFPDSGWRVHGDMRGATEDELAGRKAAYVALGAVLNKDDSWLSFIDAPVGSAFEKDFDCGVFLPKTDS